MNEYDVCVCVCILCVKGCFSYVFSSIRVFWKRKCQIKIYKVKHRNDADCCNNSYSNDNDDDNDDDDDADDWHKSVGCSKVNRERGWWSDL